MSLYAKFEADFEYVKIDSIKQGEGVVWVKKLFNMHTVPAVTC